MIKKELVRAKIAYDTVIMGKREALLAASASASAPLAGGRIRELARKTIDELRKARTKKYNYSSNKCNTRRRK